MILQTGHMGHLGRPPFAPRTVFRPKVEPHPEGVNRTEGTPNMADSDLQSKVRLIIESAMAELKLAGASHDAAASLLAIQGCIRIESRASLEEVAEFINGMLDGDDDDDAGSLH